MWCNVMYMYIALAILDTEVSRECRSAALPEIPRYSTINYITLHYSTVPHITVHCMALYCIALHWVALHYNTIQYDTSQGLGGLEVDQKYDVQIFALATLLCSHLV